MQWDEKQKRQAILTAVMLVLTFGITALVRIDIHSITEAGTNADAGVYVSLGDVCVYASVLLLGGPWGALVSAVGSAVADIVVGSYDYIIGSILIKGGMAFFVSAFCLKCDSWKRCLVIAALTETIMALGYFLYNLLIRAQYSVAALELPLDLAQGIVCGAVGMLILKYLPARRPDAMPKIKRRRVE